MHRSMHTLSKLDQIWPYRRHKMMPYLMDDHHRKDRDKKALSHQIKSVQNQQGVDCETVGINLNFKL